MIKVAAALFALSVSTAAFAQSATPEDERACSASVKRYCSATIRDGDMAILGCLQQNRQRIAATCQRVLIKYGQ